AIKVAVIPCGLVPTCAGVTVVEHVAALPPFGARVQVPNTSVLSVDVNAIVPCGLDCGAASVSVMVTAIVLACPTATVLGVSVTPVVVARLLIVSVCVAEVSTKAWSAPWIMGEPEDVPLKKKFTELAVVGMLTLLMPEVQLLSEKNAPVPPEVTLKSTCTGDVGLIPVLPAFCV